VTAPATIKPLQDFWQLTEEEDAATQVYAAKIAIEADDRRSCFVVSILEIDEIKLTVAKTKRAPVATTTTTVLTDSDDEAINAWQD